MEKPLEKNTNFRKKLITRRPSRKKKGGHFFWHFCGLREGGEGESGWSPFLPPLPLLKRKGWRARSQEIVREGCLGFSFYEMMTHSVVQAGVGFLKLFEFKEAYITA